MDDLFNQLIIQFDIQYNILIKFTHFYKFPQSSLALETRLFILMFTELFVKILAKKKNLIEISLKYINTVYVVRFMHLNIQLWKVLFLLLKWICLKRHLGIFTWKQDTDTKNRFVLMCESLELFINGQICSFEDLWLLCMLLLYINTHLACYIFWFRYWSPIDEMLREAAVLREVKVRLLIGLWTRTHPLTFNFMTSMQALCTGLPFCSIEVVRKEPIWLIC